MNLRHLGALLGGLLTLGFATPALADREACPTPYVKANERGSIYFKMSPDPAAPCDRTKGSGAAYQVAVGADQLLWKTEGSWYAQTTFLSEDGRYLIRIGNWPRGRKPSKDHLAIAFYDNGKLLKRYSTLELIKDPSQVETSVSHYAFYHDPPGFTAPHAKTFLLTTIDGIAYTFNITTGEIASTKKQSATP